MYPSTRLQPFLLLLPWQLLVYTTLKRTIWELACTHPGSKVVSASMPASLSLSSEELPQSDNLVNYLWMFSWIFSTSKQYYLGIQLAKLSGFSPIITTASEHNDPLLKSFGATHVLSRNLSVSELESAIKDIVGGKPIEIVYDAVSTAETQQLGWDVLGVGGSLVTVNHPLPINKRRQEGAKQVVLSNGGVHFSTNFILGAKLYAKLTEWLECGSILVGLEIIRVETPKAYMIMNGSQTTPSCCRMVYSALLEDLKDWRRTRSAV